MASNTLIIVGADKGGVGKTTVSRALLDYLAACDVPARAFDTECPHGTLKRFYPDIAEVVDITAVPDQMRILDSIRSANKATVVDVRAGMLSATLQFFENIGLAEALKSAEVKLVLFHVVGSSISSLREIGEITTFVPTAKYFMVKNFINDSTFFNWDPALHDMFFFGSKSADEITIPKLNEMAYEQVESAAIPFASFIANRGASRDYNFSFVLRGYVRHWLGNVWAEFDRIKLLDIIKPGRPPAPSQSADGLVSLPMSLFPLRRHAATPQRVEEDAPADAV